MFLACGCYVFVVCIRVLTNDVLNICLLCVLCSFYMFVYKLTKLCMYVLAGFLQCMFLPVLSFLFLLRVCRNVSMF
jgi:hypothetical protein